MTPDDDPEARIRELERPLTDVARASELGSDVAPTPAPWPGQYVAQPYASVPRTGFSIRWWVIGIAVAVVMFGAGIAAYTATKVSRGPSVVTVPGVLAPSRSPGRIGAPSTSSSPSVTTAAPGAQVSVAGAGGIRTIACSDGDVNVSGVSNTVTITGHCGQLTVSGVENQVRVDTADAINASGFNNQVTYQSGEPQIDSTSNNVVKRG